MRCWKKCYDIRNTELNWEHKLSLVSLSDYKDLTQNQSCKFEGNHRLMHYFPVLRHFLLRLFFLHYSFPSSSHDVAYTCFTYWVSKKWMPFSRHHNFLHMSARSRSHDRKANMVFAAQPLSFSRPVPYNSNEGNSVCLCRHEENTT